MGRPHRRTGTTQPATESRVQAAPLAISALSGNGSDLHESIARLAYQRFEERGREHGHDLDDWLEAERELANENTAEAN